MPKKQAAEKLPKLSEMLDNEDGTFDGLLWLTKDLKNAARMLSPVQQGVLVDLYYQMQENRKRSANQTRAAKQHTVADTTSDEEEVVEEPNMFVSMVGLYQQRLETLIASALDISTDQLPVSKWAKSNFGVGGILAAGLVAYIDITKTPHRGNLCRLAGIDPTKRWIGRDEARVIVNQIIEDVGDDGNYEKFIPIIAAKISHNPDSFARVVERMGKGQITKDALYKATSLRPWNAQLKTLVWKISRSFAFFHKNEKCYYGQIYRKRKIQEIQFNDSGKFSDQAVKLAPHYGKNTESWSWYNACYPAGTTVVVVNLDTISGREAYLKKVRGKPGSGQPMLPPGHLDNRAKRYAAKRFLSDYWQVAYAYEYKKMPPKPYILVAQPELHTKYEPPPGWDAIVQELGLKE